MIFELVRDFSSAVSALPKDHPRHRILTLLEEAIRYDAHFIDRHPTTLFQCMWNTCWWYDYAESNKDASTSLLASDAPKGKLQSWMETWRLKKEGNGQMLPWVCSLRPPPLSLGTGLIAQLEPNDSLGTRGQVFRMAFSRNESWLGAAFSDGTLGIYSFRTVVFQRQRARVAALVQLADKDGLQVITRDGTILRVTEADVEPEIVRELNRELSGPVALAPNGALVASVSENNSVSIVAINNGLEIARFGGHKENITTLAFSMDSSVLASGSRDRSVRLWDIRKSSQIGILRRAGHEVNTVAFSPDASQLVSGTDYVRLWETRRKQLIATLWGTTGLIEHSSYSPDGQHVAAVFGGGSVENLGYSVI